MARARNFAPSRPRRRRRLPIGRAATARSSTMHRSICRPASPAMKTSTPTATGSTTAATAASGCRVPCRAAGRPIAPAIGPTCSRGAGPGSTSSRGALRHTITAAGPIAAIAGSGCRRSAMSGRSMRRRWWLSSAAPNWPCRSATRVPRRSAGSRSARAKSMCPLTRAIANTTGASTARPASRIASSRIDGSGHSGARQSWPIASRR